MPDDNTAQIDKLRQAVAALEAQQHELGLDFGAQIAELRRRLEEARGVSQSGSGVTATAGGVAAGTQGIAVGGSVHGDIIYQVYQSPPGRVALTRRRFQRILDEYLRGVQNAYSKARLYGLESAPTAQGHPVRELSQVFVPLSLRRFQPLRRDEVEQFAGQMQGDLSRAYLRLVEARQREGETVSLNELLTLNNKLAIVGSAGSGKSTLVAFLAASLCTAALTGQPLPLALPRGKSTLVPVVIPLRYFREYLRLCEHSPQERLRHPRVGTLAGFIPWDLKRRNPALETSEDFFDRLLLGGGCLLLLDGLDEVVSREDRGRVRQQVEDMVHHVYPGNQVLVTAREAGYRENAVFGDDFLRLDVQHLDDHQIRALVANWCTQLYRGEEDRRTEELVRAIRDINNLRADRELPPLVISPLMTTMVVSVKWGETELPRERAKLYEACVKVILQAQYIPDDPARTELVEWGGSWEDQRNWLAALAVEMHEGGRAGAAVPEDHVREVLCHELSPESVDRFLEAVRQRGGLLEEKAQLFQFVHHTFQEFLVARWLAKQRQGAWPHLLPHFTDAWWREIFLLTYGFAQSDHPPFAREYLDWLSTHTRDGEARLAGLELAGAALLELEKPNPEIRRQQAERLKEALRDPGISASRFVRARAGDTLAHLGDPRFRLAAWYLPDEPLLGFVEIPAGPFQMGSNKTRDRLAIDAEVPQHLITLPRFYLARYPVTVAQFQAFVEESGEQTEDENSLRGLPNHPVVNITWFEALKYCDWLTERLRGWEGTPEPLATLVRQEGWRVSLPGEAEWEKAARGPDGQIYPWGNEFDPDRANCADAGLQRTSAVGCFPGGASPYGVEELSGNVWEWTRSVWRKYPYPSDMKGRARRENLKALRNEPRVMRGGAFGDLRGDVRCACRGGLPYARDGGIGFRVGVLPCL